MSLKRRISVSPRLSILGGLFVSFADYFRFRPVRWGRLFVDYARDFSAYRRSNTHELLTNDRLVWYPCLGDAEASNPIEPIYFTQSCWCARKVFDAAPARHVDVGSSVVMLGIMAQGIPTVFVDIRDIPMTVPGLTYVEGSILSLPFEDDSIESLSSICVIEHIGLGRYGDPIDAEGSEKALSELARVLSPEGNLYITVPVDDVDRVYFNAHRAFTPERMAELFARHGLTATESLYLYDMELGTEWKPERGFGTGFYHLRKNAARIEAENENE
jgi:SAM-dependent methyltransferase